MVTPTPAPRVQPIAGGFGFTDVIALIALAIALFDLVLHAFEFWRERTGLRISQVTDDYAYSFGFIWYQTYECLFFKLRIENKTKTPVTVSRFFLEDSKGKTYEPSMYELSDHYNEKGMSLLYRDNSRMYEAVNLKTENLLNDLRIVDHGCNAGYLLFYGVPVIEKQTETFILHVHTPNKRYKERILIKKLPDNLKPYHEIKAKVQA